MICGCGKRYSDKSRRPRCWDCTKLYKQGDSDSLEAREHQSTIDSHTGQTFRGISTLVDSDGNTLQEWLKTRTLGLDPDDAHPPLPTVDRVSTLYDNQGRVSQQWVSTRTKDEQKFTAWTAIADELKAGIKPISILPVPSSPLKDDLLVGYPVGDHHLGMLSWANETGANWDIHLGERALAGAMEYLVNTSPPAASAAVVFLGDFMHYDSFEPVTPTSRNLLDADGRFPKLVRASLRAMRHAIEVAAEKHDTVRVVVEVGNHDLSSSVFLMESLAILYENNPRVLIDTSPRHYHYFQHGKVLIGVHHGHGTKTLSKLPGIMAADQPEAWGSTEHRYWWTGHVHHERKQEFPGCIVESFRVLAPRDAWHDQHGYRSGRDMKAIVLHKEYGEVSRITVNPGMLSIQ